MTFWKTFAKSTLGGIVGYLAGILAGFWFTEDYITLIFPVVGTLAGVIWAKLSSRSTANLDKPLAEPVHIQDTLTTDRPLVSTISEERPANRLSSSSPAPVVEQEAVPPIFQPVLEYLAVLEDMVISEGQKNNLDNEIVEKSCSLFLRLQRVLPMLGELHNDEINHTVKRLVLKDLNSIINPFLRLSGEAKSKNRRVLLDGIRDVDSRITHIVKTIEHKDLMELQTRAELLHQRYS